MNLPSGNYLTYMAQGDDGRSLIASLATAAMPEPTRIRLQYLGAQGG
jgi:hypothetical protein